MITVMAENLLSPITGDGRIICQGLNYSEHATEAQHHVRRQNLIFMKASSALTGPYAPIFRPGDVELLDYEVEIGLVLRSALGQDTDVTDENIGTYVAGVVLCNDVSARDVMFGASFMQWFQGKSYRSFCPAGPLFYLLEEHEVRDTLEKLEIRLWVNSELRQSAISSQLIFKPAETLSQLSRLMDLGRGDLLLTGTPGGVTAPATPKLVDILKTHLLDDDLRRDGLRQEMPLKRPFLMPGDVVSAHLRDVFGGLDLGGQENPVMSSVLG